MMNGAVLQAGDLGPLGDQLGSGGQATVHEAPALTLPDAPERLVYKKYRPGGAPRPHDMTRLVGLRAGLSPPDQARLDAVATWPLRAVMDGGDLAGVVLPRIPDSYFQPVVQPSGRRKTLVREVQHLFVDAAYSRRIGMPEVGWDERVVICRDLAAALDFLHSPSMDVVFGDISAKNEVFRLGAEPAVMFVDCDAVRKRGDVTGAPQLNSPDWAPPRQVSLNRDTDRYKLALFVLRCLATPGPQVSTLTDPDAATTLDADGRKLLSAALTGVGDRPSAFDWLRYLSRLAGQPLDPPVLGEVVLDRTLVAAGEPVEVRWTATDAITIEIAGPELGVVVDGRPGRGTIRVEPVRMGAWTVTARNSHGADVRPAGPVSVVSMPDWSDLPVPMPHLDLGSVMLPEPPDLRAVIPPLPAIAELPSTTAGRRPAAPPLPDLLAGILDPVDVVSLIRTGGDR